MTLKVLLQGMCAAFFMHGVYFYAFKRADFCGKEEGRCDAKKEVKKARIVYLVSALIWTTAFVLIQIFMK